MRWMFRGALDVRRTSGGSAQVRANDARGAPKPGWIRNCLRRGFHRLLEAARFQRVRLLHNVIERGPEWTQMDRNGRPCCTYVARKGAQDGDKTAWVGAVRRLPSKRYQASYQGPDLLRHAAPRTFESRMDAEGWLVAERRLTERDDRNPSPRGRRHRLRRTAALGLDLREWPPSQGGARAASHPMSWPSRCSGCAASTSWSSAGQCAWRVDVGRLTAT